MNQWLNTAQDDRLPGSLRSWRSHMNFTQREAAKALELTLDEYRTFDRPTAPWVPRVLFARAKNIRENGRLTEAAPPLPIVRNARTTKTTARVVPKFSAKEAAVVAEQIAKNLDQYQGMVPDGLESSFCKIIRALVGSGHDFPLTPLMTKWAGHFTPDVFERLSQHEHH